MLEAARRMGAVVKSWREYGFLAAVDLWTDVTNEAFSRHWGWNPITRDEVRPMLTPLGTTLAADLSMVAILDDAPVGAVFSVPDLSRTLAQVRPGVRLKPERGGGTRDALRRLYAGARRQLALASYGREPRRPRHRQFRHVPAGPVGPHLQRILLPVPRA